MAFELNEKNAKTLCPLAWAHSFVNNDGHVQLCCTSEESDNTIRDDEGKKIHVLDDLPVETTMNTKFMKQIRSQMIEGEWPSVCRRCESTERQGGSSRRVVELKANEEAMTQMLAATEPDGTIATKITSADYRLGNLCNLQCRMCSPKASRMWVHDWDKLGPVFMRNWRKANTVSANYDWIDSESAIRDLRMKAVSLDQLHFAGGEPLLTQQMSRMLQECVDAGNAQNITLTYNTNLTQLPTKVLELWKQFKAVKLFVSIDAAGELNDYIRFPSKWEQLDRNLKFIEAHHQEFNVTECLISTTVQAVNVCHITELVSYLSQFKFIVRMPNLVNLYHPAYLATTVLPPAIKKLAVRRLNELSLDTSLQLQPQYHYLLETVLSAITFMMGADGYRDGHFDVFKKFTRDYDDLKGLDLLASCPEFAPFVTTKNE